jgi:hypothetical protein
MLIAITQGISLSLRAGVVGALLTTGIGATICTTGFADTLEDRQRLGLIADTADRICNVIVLTGNAHSDQVKGELKAQLSGLAAKLADVGVEGSATLNNENYQNVLQQDLPTVLKDSTACKLKVFDALQVKLLSSTSGASHDTPPSDPGANTAQQALVPRFDISGSKKTSAGIAHFSQDGSKVGWVFDTPTIRHSMSGHYISATQFTGTQTRVSTNGCTVSMVIDGTVMADRSFEFDGHIANDSPSSCDLPANYQEHASHSNYSSMR